MPISSHCFWPWLRRASALRRALQAHGLEDFVDALLLVPSGCRTARRTRRAPALSAARDCPDRVALEHRRLLELPADAEIGDVASSSLVRSVRRRNRPRRIGPGLAGDDVHHRGLAGAVRADDGRISPDGRDRQAFSALKPSKDDRDAVEIEHGVRLVMVIPPAAAGRLIWRAASPASDGRPAWWMAAASSACWLPCHWPTAHDALGQEQRHHHEQRAQREQPVFRQGAVNQLLPN
jgi:hypothetical protein